MREPEGLRIFHYGLGKSLSPKLFLPILLHIILAPVPLYPSIKIQITQIVGGNLQKTISPSSEDHPRLSIPQTI